MHGIVIIRFSLIASMPSGVRVQCMFFDCFQKFMNYYELRRSVANNCNMCSEWNALRWIKNLGFSWKKREKYAFFPFRLRFTFKKNVPPVHLSTYANIPPEQISHECVDFQTKMLSDHVGNFNSFARKKKFNSFLLLLQNSISFQWNDSILSTFSILWCMLWHLLQLLVCLGCSSTSNSTNYQWLYFDAAFK